MPLAERGHRESGTGHRPCLPARPAPSPFVTARPKPPLPPDGISSTERSPPGADERAAHLYCSLPYPQVCPITSDPAGQVCCPRGLGGQVKGRRGAGVTNEHRALASVFFHIFVASIFSLW